MSNLPFLKRNKEASMSAPIESMERKPDQEQDFSMLDAVADDLMEAVKTDNKQLLKDALESLVAHIQSMDEDQDQKDMK